jgi:hypothetical protein
METEKYNGWYNYATWRVNLEVLDGYDWSETEAMDNITELGDYIKDMVEEIVLGSSTADGFAYDYAYAFLSDVNYYEIAQHIAEEYPKLIRK